MTRSKSAAKRIETERPKPDFGSIEQRGSTFRAIWWMDGKRQPPVTRDTYTEAYDFLQDLALNKRKGVKLTDFRKAQTPWGVFAWEWHGSRSKDPNQAASREKEKYAIRKFEPTFAAIPIGDITRKAIQDWINDVTEDPAWTCDDCEDEQIETGDDEARCAAHRKVKVLGSKSLMTYYEVIGQIFRDAQLDGYLPNGCPIGKGLHKLPQVENREVWLDDDETDHLLAVAVRTTPKDAALVHVGAHTGARPGELFGLHRDNYLMNPRTGKRYLLISKGAKKRTRTVGPTKTNKPRRVELFDCCVEVLDAHLVGHEYGLIFPGAGGRVMGADNWRKRVWNPLRDAAGFGERGLQFKDLRHSHCTNLLLNDWRVEVVSKRLGHSSVKMTYDRYRHVISDEQRDMMDRHGLRATSRRLKAV